MNLYLLAVNSFSNPSGDIPPTIGEFEVVFSNVVNVVLGIGGIVLFIMLLTGGIKFITAGGDPKGIDAAKKTITYAIFGVVFLALAYLILVLIQQITGANVTEFKIISQ